MDREIGVLPYRIRNEELEIVLVTTRGRKHWIFPKGQTNKRLKDSKVAQIEAFEEAGIIGDIETGNDREFYIRRGNRKIKIHVFPMKCKKVLIDWPECDQRERVVIRIDQGLKMIKGKTLRKCVKCLLRDVA